MVTDIFSRRYSRIFHGDRPTPAVATFLVQAAHIIFGDLVAKIDNPRSFFDTLHSRLARELGTGRLGPGNTSDEICGRFLSQPYDLWNDQHGDADYFIRSRLSLIEIAFREFESAAQRPGTTRRPRGLLASLTEGTSATSLLSEEVHAAVTELNARFRQAELPLHYHNGLIQLSSDHLTQNLVEGPFWDLLTGVKWKSVDLDMKEALHRRDIGGRDAALYAMKALESVIKIICDEKRWTSSKEKGAANFIDHLVSEKNGKFIAAWEADALRSLFRDVRNPHGHGPGSSVPPSLSDNQVTLVIELCMIWIKTLVKRM